MTQSHFVMQDTLKSSLEVSVIPAFEMSCRTMFEQVDTAFQKGMVEHTSVAQQQFEASHSPLALALRVLKLTLCNSDVSISPLYFISTRQ